ncbi:major facilitator superfamily domain-containing protein 4A isoform X2 [Cololabis saira]|uniref:major facilitator superfamily domain-containing protein 4A isoform X2 n=1 Tax=Cololabis saira TaxID=129043 RepID=UPI002AD49036|nr:major facilitator superfamily domain-containing protein 4A isoform X2 [Cololabis saira]
MQLQDGGFCSPFRRNLQQTLTYWSVFFSFGLCIAFLGPTILDLRCQTQSSLQQITWGFFCQQVSLLGGSGLGGQLRNSLVTSLTALLCSTLVISLMFAIIPFCHHVILLSVAMGLGGLAMGVIDTIANLQLVKLYQKDSAIALQALHFFIGLGALISPLVTEPFLSEDSCVLGFNSTTNTSSSWNLHHLRNTLAGSGAALHNTSQYPLYVEGIVVTKVAYAFWIMALINLPVPAAVLALMHHQRLLPCSSTSPRLLDREPGSHSAGDGCHGDRSLFDCCKSANVQDRPTTFFLLHVLGGAIVFITDGIIGSYAGFVYTYAVSPPLLMRHQLAGYLDSVFWASITAGRLAFIYFSCRYTAPVLITISLVGVILVQCLLLFFYTSGAFLFIATCVLGFCISSVFPSMLAFTEDTLDYKGCATTVLVTSASTGEMTLQLLIGSVIHSRGSYSFLLSSAVTSVLSFCLFLLLLHTQRLHRNQYTDSFESIDMKEKPKTGDT